MSVRWDYCARCRAWIEVGVTKEGDLCRGCRRTARLCVPDLDPEMREPDLGVDDAEFGMKP